MSDPKEQIPVEKIRQLHAILEAMSESVHKALLDYEAAGIVTTPVKNWKTLHRGLVYVARTTKQICGPASKIQTIDLDQLPMPPNPKKAKRAEEKKADLAKLDEAEAKLKELQRKRKPRST